MRFAAGAERAREEHAMPDALHGPLHGQSVHVHTLQSGGQGSNGPALRKLVMALGGQVHLPS